MERSAKHTESIRRCRKSANRWMLCDSGLVRFCMKSEEAYDVRDEKRES